MKKKKTKIMTVSLRRGIALIKAITSTFIPSMLLIVRNGLRILKALITLILIFPVSRTN